MVCIGYARKDVDFMLFVSISFAFGDQCERVFWWNMGLTIFDGEYQVRSSSGPRLFRIVMCTPKHITAKV